MQFFPSRSRNCQLLFKGLQQHVSQVEKTSGFAERWYELFKQNRTITDICFIILEINMYPCSRTSYFLILIVLKKNQPIKICLPFNISLVQGVVERKSFIPHCSKTMTWHGFREFFRPIFSSLKYKYNFVVFKMKEITRKNIWPSKVWSQSAWIRFSRHVRALLDSAYSFRHYEIELHFVALDFALCMTVLID